MNDKKATSATKNPQQKFLENISQIELFENIPYELKNTPQWVNFVLQKKTDKQGIVKITKPPINPKNNHKADPTKDFNFSTFSEAIKNLPNLNKVKSIPNLIKDKHTGGGIGFCLTKNDGFTAIDVDHCIKNGKLSEQAEHIVQLFSSYTEISPSGEGLRIFIKGSLPKDSKKKNGNFEAYSEQRYVTVTGRLLEQNLNRVEEKQDQLESFSSLYLQGNKGEKESKRNTRKKNQSQNQNQTYGSSSLSDSEVIEKASKAKNGSGQEFQELFFQGFQQGSKWGTHSQADHALLKKLVFWTNADKDQIDRIFRNSALYRNKWDDTEKGSTYKRSSLNNAITAQCHKLYQGKNQKQKTQPQPNNSTSVEQEVPQAQIGFKASSKQELQPQPQPNNSTSVKQEVRQAQIIQWEQISKNREKSYRGEDQVKRSNLNFIVENPNTGNVSINTGIAGKYFSEKWRENLIFSENEFYEFKAGYWIPTKEREIRLEIAKEIPYHLSKSHIKTEIIEEMKDELERRDLKFNQHAHLLNFKNGVLDIETGQLLPHKREYYQNFQFNQNFNPKAKAPKFLRFLEELEFKKETKDFIQEWMGYCFYPHVMIQKCLYLKGEGANGKSVLLEVIAEMIGRDNSCRIEPAELRDFKLINIKDKLINIATDISTKSTLENTFKELVRGEEQNAEIKHEKFTSNFIPIAKHMFSSNNFIPTKDRSHGFFRQFAILEFKRIFEEKDQDKNLKFELFEEIEGITIWAIQGLHRLVNNGWMLTRSNEMAEIEKEFKKGMNPLAQFIEEECTISANSEVSKNDFQEDYVNWCQKNRYTALSSYKLTQEMKRLGFKTHKKENPYKKMFLGLELTF